MADDIKKKKISELPQASNIDGLFSLGLDGEGVTVKVPIEILKGNVGDKGDPGAAPVIGENGNWWIDGVDTGKVATGDFAEYAKTTTAEGTVVRTANGEIPTVDISGKADKIDTNGNKVVYTDTDNAIYGDIIIKDTDRFIPSDLLALLQSYGLDVTPANFLARNAIKEGATVDAGLLLSGYNALNPIIISNASVVLIPGAYKSGVVYGLNPRTGEAVNFNFSRATSGTYHSKDLDMHLASANMPRLDYKNYSSNAKILIEKASTNLAIQSEGVKPPYFGNYEVTDMEMLSFTKKAVLYKTIVAGENTLYIYRHCNNVEGRYFYTFLSKSSITGGANITYGIKADVDIALMGNHNTQNTSVNKTLIKDSIYKHIIELNTNSMSSFNFGINRYSTNRNTADVYLTAFQIEQGTEPTSYIPTTTAQVTRSADNLSYTLENACSVYLKTTKQNVVLDKPSGVWNIHEDLSNEGILQIAIFDRVLTESEKSQLKA